MLPTPLRVRIAIWAWLIAALLVGHYGLLQRLPLPAVQGVLFAVTALLLVLYLDRKSTRLNSSHIQKSRMPSSA